MPGTEFILTSLIVVLAPGTGVIYTVSTGLSSDWKASIAAAVGCTAGIIPHITACILGLSAIMDMSARTFHIIKMAGSIYLLYLAWSMWKGSNSLSFEKKEVKGKTGAIILKGFLINILNPKLTIFFFAFLPVFIVPDAAPAARQLIILSLAFMAMTLVVFIGYGLLAGAVSSFLIKSRKSAAGIQKCFALVFAATALKLAASRE